MCGEGPCLLNGLSDVLIAVFEAACTAGEGRAYIEMPPTKAMPDKDLQPALDDGSTRNSLRMAVQVVLLKAD